MIVAIRPTSSGQQFLQLAKRPSVWLSFLAYLIAAEILSIAALASTSILAARAVLAGSVALNVFYLAILTKLSRHLYEGRNIQAIPWGRWVIASSIYLMLATMMLNFVMNNLILWMPTIELKAAANEIIVTAFSVISFPIIVYISIISIFSGTMTIQDVFKIFFNDMRAIPLAVGVIAIFEVAYLTSLQGVFHAPITNGTYVLSTALRSVGEMAILLLAIIGARKMLEIPRQLSQHFE